MQFTPEQQRIVEIFLPYAMDRRRIALSEGTRFVHYTGADAATNILRTKCVWMRKSSCMNDYMEVEHGLNCLRTAYRGEAGRRFKKTLDLIFEGVSTEVEKQFDGWVPHFQTDTYFTCFSEHRNTEDTFGRLSMWRAYGAETGVAFVMNSTPFLAPSDALGAYTSPIAYVRDPEIAEQFGIIADRIAANAQLVRSIGREALQNFVFNMLRFAAVCTKHPGFEEEKEWRVVFCPTLHKSNHLTKEIKVVGGVPQPIYKIPLKDIPEQGFVGAEISTLVERIIIGPAKFPVAMREAFIELLGNAGVPDPANRVFISDIPLRT